MRRFGVLLVVALLVPLCSSIASADPGDLDSGFGTAGIVSGGLLDEFHDVAVDPSSGAIVVAGVSGATTTVARYLPDGTPDTDFASDGGAELTLPNPVRDFLDLEVLDDGSVILVVITRDPLDVFSDELVAVRLSADGVVDATYGTAGVASEALAFTHLYDSASVGEDGSVLFSARGQGIPANSWTFVVDTGGDITTGPDYAFDTTDLPAGCSIPDGFTPGFGAAAVHRMDAGTFAVLGVTTLVCNSVATELTVLSLQQDDDTVLWSHFLPEGEAPDFDATQIPLISDGDELLFATADSGGTNVRRVDGNGDAAAGWGTAGSADAPAGVAPVGDIAVLPNGDVAVLSGPSLGLSAPDVQVAVLDPDGSVDAGFSAAAVSAGDLTSTALAVALDGALLVVHDPVSGTGDLRRYETVLQQTYVPLAEPVRLADTRAGGTTVDGLFQAGGIRNADTTLELTVGGRGGIPTGASTVVLNITAVTPQAPGFITVHACGTTRPLAASLVFSDTNISNSVTAKLGTGDAVCIYVNRATHLVVDASGFHPTTANLTPLAEPVRLADTRAGGTTVDGLFQAGGIRNADTTLELTVGGRGGIPTGASTVVLNITAVTPQAPGFITVHACGTTRPLAASLVFSDTNISNSVTAKLGTGDAVCIYVNRATHLVVDASGFHPTTANLTPLAEPVRLADTRAGGTTVDGLFQAGGIRNADTTLELTVGGRGGIPTGASTVVLNITAVTPQAPGFITVHACGTTRPLAASLVFSDTNISNSVTAKLGTGDAVCIYVNRATHLVVDASAYEPTL